MTPTVQAIRDQLIGRRLVDVDGQDDEIDSLVFEGGARLSFRWRVGGALSRAVGGVIDVPRAPGRRRRPVGAH
jgi:hypothetical protein